MRVTVVCTFCLFAAIGGLFAQQQTAMVPDEIFFNGKIITVDSAFKIQEAFAVRGETFLAIGKQCRNPRSLGTADEVDGPSRPCGDSRPDG